MRDLMKKMEEDLVVHKPNAASARAGAPEETALPFDAARLAGQLHATRNAAERARLLAAIQGRFGNAFAERVVDAARSPAGPPPALGGFGDGQP